ncbi:MAG: hypothetical protein H6570_13220 [Lewinellaceae bacterium]|nr:hypothetical protein [Lewinellaceae bacterium]
MFNGVERVILDDGTCLTLVIAMVSKPLGEYTATQNYDRMPIEIAGNARKFRRKPPYTLDGIALFLNLREPQQHQVKILALLVKTKILGSIGYDSTPK